MQLRSEIEQCHKEPVEKLNKQEQKLVLQIIEREAQIAENLSIDNFICSLVNWLRDWICMMKGVRLNQYGLSRTPLSSHMESILTPTPLWREAYS